MDTTKEKQYISYIILTSNDITSVSAFPLALFTILYEWHPTNFESYCNAHAIDYRLLNDRLKELQDKKIRNCFHVIRAIALYKVLIYFSVCFDFSPFFLFSFLHC